MANRSKLILADVPTGKMITKLLHEPARSVKTTITAVTHGLEIAGQTDLIFTLHDGKLTATKYLTYKK